MGRAPVNIHAARTQFSRLVERGVRPVARLVPLAAPPRTRRAGLLKGKIRVPKNFDAPLPEDVLRLFEGR